ncbi:hypothetical protein RI578_22740 [Streptomyces sp. BB1-1-1]|uniref:hypothetical protein n=1 Tax=Streptomyces sp. BB1-1-1 TaxID=3074430 RepID=UPI0028781126|nr:hypothetical protein [Streptomyces sp. BB1-1-1]WND36928.1 hypothetical protein RI578_22740 [Streptomyces sp. BB1-1-1]
MSDDNGTQAGQQGTGQQGDPGAGQQGGQGTGQDPAGTAPPNGQQAQQGNDGEDPAAKIARLEADLAAARQEAGKNRTTAKQRAADEARQQLTAQLLGILDPSKAGQQATPEELTQQLTTAQDQARQTAVELAVYRTASTAGADPDALLDSRTFAESVAKLDPTDTTAITAAITAAVQANPRLAAQQQATQQQAAAGPARTGAEFAGGGGAAEVTPAQFAAMTYAQRVELMQSDPDTYRRLAGS